MNSIAEINGGSGVVTLRGIVVEIDGAVGQAFVADVCRYIEDLMSADALRTKYGLLDDGAWAGLAENEPLQRAIAAAKTRRIHDGSAARERAQHAFLAAPNILNGIMNDTSASSRHRIESIRELRQIASVGPTDAQAAAERERFVININFGSNKLHKEIELKPVKPETLTIEHSDDEREGEYGF
jgi:hypothetical protein